MLIDSRHLAFVLWDVLEADALFRLPAFAHVDRGSAEGVLATAEAIARDVFLPSYRTLDDSEPRFENGRVVMPPETALALARFREAGFFAMTAEPSDGGTGLPRTIANAAFLWFQAANISIANYAMLTMSAAELLAQHGTVEQQARWMAPMLEGRYLGTMALSEPHAGSSLGDITTTARALPDGRYALRGTKMWISGGEHDMSENIVHLMLARIEGAPKGVKGISLFAVPRKRLDSSGRPTAHNHIALAGLNHKMGQRGTVNTILAVGEGGDTIGEIVGAPGQGLACMFTMMNEARIGVSMGAVAHASAGFRHSLAYARERLQGRPAGARDPGQPQVPIVAHPDVRRMLVEQKIVAEGGTTFALYLARLADLKKAAATPAARADAGLLLDLLTPVFKAWMSEAALAANSAAIQVLGGAGYTRDHPVEQYWRDNRLNPIHEGTNGIQAIDLVGRKLRLADGRAIALLVAEMRSSLEDGVGPQGSRMSRLAGRMDGLAMLVERMAACLDEVRDRDGEAAALAHAHEAMELMGTVTLAWMWWLEARAAARAASRLPAVPDPFLDPRPALAEVAFDQLLPRAEAALDRIAHGHPAALAVTDAMLG
jgi:butyryl-CoA dehydrogenase